MSHSLDHEISLHNVYPIEMLVQEVQNTTFSFMGQKVLKSPSKRVERFEKFIYLLEITDHLLTF